MTQAVANFLAWFDELNVPSLLSMSADEAVDRFNELLEDAYYYGFFDAQEQLQVSGGIDDELLEAAIFFGYDNETLIQNKMADYVRSADEAAARRLLESELHRVFATGSLDTAKRASGTVYKRWSTMGDDRVRDTHDYLEGVTAPLNGLFYTYDGDSAAAPGLFGNAANNANCRCWLVYQR